MKMKPMETTDNSLLGTHSKPKISTTSKFFRLLDATHAKNDKSIEENDNTR